MGCVSLACSSAVGAVLHIVLTQVLVLCKQVLDKRLEGREWLATDRFTLAVRLTCT